MLAKPKSIGDSHAIDPIDQNYRPNACVPGESDEIAGE